MIYPLAAIAWFLMGVPGILLIRHDDIRRGRYVKGYKEYTWSRRCLIGSILFALILGPACTVALALCELSVQLHRRGFFRAINNWLNRSAP